MIAILLGVLVGLAVGWFVIKPKPAQDAAITQLRPDYQTDAVLMVAETFARDGDQMLALDRLARLSHDNLLTFVGKALQNAEILGYAKEDEDSILRLLEGLDLVVYDNWKILRGWHD